jgi:hypothetical protein
MKGPFFIRSDNSILLEGKRIAGSRGWKRDNGKSIVQSESNSIGIYVNYIAVFIATYILQNL